MSAYTKSLREQYAAAVTEYQSKLTAAGTSEELDQAESILNGAELIERKIQKLEAAEALESKLAVSRTEAAAERGISVDQHIHVMHGQASELARYLTGGLRAMTDDERADMYRRTAPQYRTAASVGTDGAGGYTVAPEFLKELQIAMIAQGGVREVARNITTSTGADMPVPLLDDTAQVAVQIDENTAVSAATDLPFTTVTLKAWKWTSGEMAVSNELINDSAFNVDAMISSAIAGRFVRGMNAAMTTGGGTTLPKGVVVEASNAKTGATGQTASVIYSDLLTVFHGINPVYRNNASWMFNDSTLHVLRGLVDGQGRPLWNPGFAGFATNQPDTILGRPYTINQDMASMGTSNYPILFGDFSTYFIRDVQGGLMIRRLLERRALEDQVSFVAFMRSDGRKASAATSIVSYRNAAS